MPPEKPCRHAPGDQRCEAVARGAADRGKREERDATTNSQRIDQRARQKAGQRDRDDFRDQIGGLDPAHLVGSDVQRVLDRRQRGRDDLDVEDRHEHADAHHGKADPDSRCDGTGRVVFGGGRIIAESSRGTLGEGPLDRAARSFRQSRTRMDMRDQGSGVLRCPIWSKRSAVNQDIRRVPADSDRNVGLVASGGLKRRWPRICHASAGIDRTSRAGPDGIAGESLV